MVATAELDDLLGVIITRSMELLDAERATLFLYDHEHDELTSKIAAGTQEIRIPASMGIAGAVVRGKQVLNIPDAYADERFNRDVDRKTGYRTRNILAGPLLGHDGLLVGVLQALNKRTGGFDADDVSIFETLAAQAGVIIQRARLLEHLVQKQRMQQAMEIARQVQHDLLPKSNPTAEGFDIAGWSSPADETGGDIFDFFDLGEGRWTLTLADATGHGIGPALVRVNDLLSLDLNESRFVTCFFGLLDSRAAAVTYASAGQGPIFIYRRAADSFEELPATSLPLGIMAGAPFDEKVRRDLAPGDMLIVATDGFFEAVNAAGEQFGNGRLCQCIRKYRDQPAETIIEVLRTVVCEFCGSTGQADDQTAIIVKRL